MFTTQDEQVSGPPVGTCDPAPIINTSVIPAPHYRPVAFPLDENRLQMRRETLAQMNSFRGVPSKPRRKGPQEFAVQLVKLRLSFDISLSVFRARDMLMKATRSNSEAAHVSVYYTEGLQDVLRVHTKPYSYPQSPMAQLRKGSRSRCRAAARH
jgi:hypothetical protein